MIFSFQGNIILENPLHIILIAVPLIIQTFFIFGISYTACHMLKLPHNIAAPAGMIGASNFFELGMKETDKAKLSVGNSVVITLISSIFLCAFYLIFSDGIITVFGGTVNPETFRHSKEYFFWISLGIPFYMFGQAMNPIIRADGSPKFAMISTLAGAVINMILDPLFIFVFRWGMMGAAVATIIGQIITAVLAFWYLLNMKLVKPSKHDLRIIKIAPFS